MITYVQGSLFSSPADVLVNTVNLVGVMGKGIAKDFKQYFPEMFNEYQAACEKGELEIGTLQFWPGPRKSVLNFPTKRHWKQRSKVADIEEGLKTFVSEFERHSITSVAFPQLGCGNGELDWETQVRPLMELYLNPLPILVYIHLYDVIGVYEHRNQDEMARWLRSEPASLSFSEVWDDLKNLQDADVITRGVLPRKSGTRFVVCEDTEFSALKVESDSEFVEVAKDDLMDMWIRLRSFGLLSSTDVPDPYRKIGDSLVRLFERLPYVHRIRFGIVDVRESAEQISWIDGLCLIPPVETRIEFEQTSLAQFQ